MTKQDKTLLLLAYYYPPQRTSGAARPARFVKYLPEFGYSAIVVSSDGGSGAQVSGHPFEDVKTHIPSAATKLSTLAMRGMEKMLSEHSQRLRWMPAAIAAASDILKRFPVTAIWSTSPPMATHLAARRLHKRFGVPWIADFRDPFAEGPARAGGSHPFGRHYDDNVEHAIIRDADYLVANNDIAMGRWLERFPKYRDKVRVIWNGIDPEEKFGDAPPSNGRRVLAHVGDIYSDRHPGRVLASIDRLRARNAIGANEVRVRLVGPIEQDSPLWSAPAFKRLCEQGCVEYTGAAVPRPESLQVICGADGLLLLDMAMGNMPRHLHVPAKIFDYVRAGRPILAETPAGSPADQVLANSGIPYVCLRPDFTDQRMDDAILDFLRLPRERHAPSEWFWNTFDGRRQTASLVALVGNSR